MPGQGRPGRTQYGQIVTGEMRLMIGELHDGATNIASLHGAQVDTRHRVRTGNSGEPEERRRQISLTRDISGVFRRNPAAQYQGRNVQPFEREDFRDISGTGNGVARRRAGNARVMIGDNQEDRVIPVVRCMRPPDAAAERLFRPPSGSSRCGRPTMLRTDASGISP